MSSVSQAFKAFEAEVEKEIQDKLHELGRQGVEYAVEHGEYHNVTGRLRASNAYEVKGTTLRLYNDCPYCTDVEARGQDVISYAILKTEEKAKALFHDN